MKHRTAKSPQKSRHVLAVRMLVARTDWLDGRLRWEDGRVVWHTPTGSLAPDAEDLARAQRCLHKIHEYPHVSRIALGDSHGWLARRIGRLQLAKALWALPTSDLESLARPGHAGRTEAAQPLTALLAAEALCLNALPVSPAAALFALGERAAPALQEMCADATAPAAARALAALVLGAVHRSDAADRPALTFTNDEAWPARSYAWGASHGLPDDATVVVDLLARPEGPELARRALGALDGPAPFSLAPECLREWLAEGVPAARVVALAEAGPLRRGVV